MSCRGGSREIYLGGLAPHHLGGNNGRRNYYKTNYIKHVEKLNLNYPEEKLGGPRQDLGGLCPLWPQRRTATDELQTGGAGLKTSFNLV